MSTVIILEQYLSDPVYSVSSASVSAAVDESRLATVIAVKSHWLIHVMFVRD